MSIKEKYKTFAEAEANKKLELQHARNSRIREDQQIKLAQNMLQKEKEEAVRIRKAKIAENIRKSGIKRIISEAAHIKHGFVFTDIEPVDFEVESRTIIARWFIDKDTGCPVSRLNIFKWFDTNHDSFQILATIDAQSIIIRGSDSDILTGADMYNRDRLEQAVVKALVNPAETPRETGTTYQSVGPS